MDSALNQNESEFRVLVLPVLLKMLPHRYGLLHQHIKVLWNIRGQTILLEKTKNLASGNALHLRHAVRITKNNTDLTIH